MLARSGAKATAVQSSPRRPLPSAAPTPSPTPQSTSAVLTTDGAVLKAGAGSDVGPGRGNGPGCGIWVDHGWSLDDCGIEALQPTNPPTVGSVAWVTEHRTSAGGVGRGIFLMTTSATDAYWHTRFSAIDMAGGRYTHITFKVAHLTGETLSQLIVGFRANTSASQLMYDIVQMTPDYSLRLMAHRQLEVGVAKLLPGGGITDYNLDMGVYQVSNVTFSAGQFVATPQGTVPPPGPSGDFP